MLKDSYEIAKKRYSDLGVDTESVIEKLKNVTFSIHGWQADDFSGFEEKAPATSLISPSKAAAFL